MKKCKGIIALLLCFSLAFTTLATSAMAASQKQVDEATINTIMTKYHLAELPLGKVPTNIKPLEIKSADDLDKVFSAMDTPKNVVEGKGSSGSSTGSIQPMAYGSAVYSTFVFTPYAYFNIRANYRYEYSYALGRNYYAQVYGVSSDMTGFTQWIDYTADTALSYGVIVNNGLGLFAHCEGTVYYYLLINGIWRLWSGHQVKECTFINP